MDLSLLLQEIKTHTELFPFVAEVFDGDIVKSLRLPPPFLAISMAGLTRPPTTDPPAPTPADMPTLMPNNKTPSAPSQPTGPPPGSTPTDAPGDGSTPTDAPGDGSAPTDAPGDGSTPTDVPGDGSTPTDAPVDLPAPSDSPSGMPSLSPSGLPSTQPSPSPTVAPFPGPSPPPTPSPSKTPTVSPTPSPTKLPSVSPSKRPTESPTPRPSNRPSESPTQNPTPTPQPVTPAPTKVPSLVPTITPTVKPTVAFDGHGVRVFADWDNQGTRAVDVGKYFLWIESDWRAVFGEFPPTPETVTYYNVIWKGTVAVWDFNVLEREENAIPDGLEQGRRNPLSSAASGDWQTGDVIVPRYVVPNVDWRNNISSGHLPLQGQYFLFKWQDWIAAFGNDPRPEHQQTPAIICRNSQQVRSADIQTFKEGHPGGGYIHARLVDSSSPGDFERGDYLLPPGRACPKSIGSTFTPVSITAAPSNNRYSVGQGRFFFFINSDWEQAFDYPTWGDCSTSCTYDSETVDQDLTYFVVRQCRNRSEIWNGIVATSVNHFLYTTLDGAADGVGRRHQGGGADGDFETGDTIVPFSRSCSS